MRQRRNPDSTEIYPADDHAGIDRDQDDGSERKTTLQCSIVVEVTEY